MSGIQTPIEITIACAVSIGRFIEKEGPSMRFSRHRMIDQCLEIFIDIAVKPGDQEHVEFIARKSLSGVEIGVERLLKSGIQAGLFFAVDGGG